MTLAEPTRPLSADLPTSDLAGPMALVSPECAATKSVEEVTIDTRPGPLRSQEGYATRRSARHRA